MATLAQSMVNQGLILGAETTPGVAVAGGRRVLGIRGTPSWEVDRSGDRASGYKVDTAEIEGTERGAISLDITQDFNAMTYALTGGFGEPVTTPVDGVSGAYQHVYTLNPRAPDSPITFTGRWGSTVRSLLLRHFQFQGFEIGVSRNDLTLGSAAMSMTPEPTGPLPTTGVTEVKSVPTSPKKWNGWADDTWAALGTSKLLALYNGNLTIGDKYVPDYVVNSARPSFNETLEAEDTDYTGNLTVGLDATAEALIASFTARARKFIQFENLGTLLPGSADKTYGVTIKLSTIITSPGEIGTPSGSPAVTIPFDFNLLYDDTSGKVAEVTLVNTCPGLRAA